MPCFGSVFNGRLPCKVAFLHDPHLPMLQEFVGRLPPDSLQAIVERARVGVFPEGLARGLGSLWRVGFMKDPFPTGFGVMGGCCFRGAPRGQSDYRSPSLHCGHRCPHCH